MKEDNLNIWLEFMKKILQAEMENRGIAQKYLDEKQIIDMAGEIELTIEKRILKTISSMEKRQKQEEAQKSSKTKSISKEDRKKIIDLLLQGKTTEEVSQMPEFAAYAPLALEKLAEANRAKIMAMRLVPIAEIAKQEGKNEKSFYVALVQHKIDGKSIIRMRQEKAEQVKLRLSKGESVESIIQDKELNVCREAVESTQEQLKNAKPRKTKVESLPNKAQKSSKTKHISKDDKKKIIDLLLQGKTTEEVSQMPEFAAYAPLALEKLAEANRAKIMAMRLVPIAEIAKQEGKNEKSFYVALAQHKIDGKSILRMRQEKAEQVKLRLSKGESVESIIQDRRLNVCREAIESIQKQIQEQKEMAEKVGQSVEETRKVTKRDKGIIKPMRNQGGIIQQRLGKKYQKLLKVEKRKEEYIPRGDKTDRVERLLSRLEFEMQQAERRGITREQREEARKIIEFIGASSLTVNQAKRYADIVEKSMLWKLIGPIEEKQCKKMKQKSNERLIRAIEEEGTRATSIEELEQLISQIPKQIDAFADGVIRGQLQRKISELKGQANQDKLKRNIPTAIKQVAMDLASGTMDISEANKVIDKQAKENVSANLGSKFKWTEETEKKQIFIQIRNCLAEQGEAFSIINPVVTMEQLQELTGIETRGALRTIVMNQLARGQYEQAKQFCSSYIKPRENDEVSKCARELESKVRHEQIGARILSALNGEYSEEEEEKLWEIIKVGVRSKKIDLDKIILGRTGDGLYPITLKKLLPDSGWDMEEWQM